VLKAAERLIGSADQIDAAQKCAAAARLGALLESGKWRGGFGAPGR
jgi:hypothetical protein